MSQNVRDLAVVGALVLACKAWYDIITFLHTRERLRSYNCLIENGAKLVKLAVT